MRRFLIGLVLTFAALPARAQVSTEEWERCSGANTGSNIPAEARIGYCTQLIQGGRLPKTYLPLVYFNRAHIYSKNNLYDKAIADYNQAIELDPKYAYAYGDRALAYKRQGQLDLAIADFTRAIALDPQDSISYNNRGAAYEVQGQRDKTIADYRTALKLDPTSTLATTNLKRLGLMP